MLNKPPSTAIAPPSATGECDREALFKTPFSSVGDGYRGPVAVRLPAAAPGNGSEPLRACVGVMLVVLVDVCTTMCMYTLSCVCLYYFIFGRSGSATRAGQATGHPFRVLAQILVLCLPFAFWGRFP